MMEAVKLILQHGFEFILQMMVGLPKDSHEKSVKTAKQIIALKPHGVRIYPVVVLRDTKLADMANLGQYLPLSISQAIETCAELIFLFEEADIPIIRIGLMSSDSLDESSVCGGAYHPALGELCYAEAFYQKAQEQFKKMGVYGGDVLCYVPVGATSKMAGHKRENIRKPVSYTHLDVYKRQDREGEAISWHLAQLLGLDDSKPIRVTFNEITKTAITNGVKHPRVIDKNLVDAQQARRIMDRIVGYKISPILWKKIKKGLSAGRVQSVATRLIVDREREINDFIPKEYWNIEAMLLSDKSKKPYKAKFYGDAKGKMEVGNKEQADKILKDLENAEYVVKSVKRGEKQKKPYAPFTTSTMQQEASYKPVSYTHLHLCFI